MKKQKKIMTIIIICGLLLIGVRWLKASYFNSNSQKHEVITEVYPAVEDPKPTDD